MIVAALIFQIFYSIRYGVWSILSNDLCLGVVCLICAAINGFILGFYVAKLIFSRRLGIDIEEL